MKSVDIPRETQRLSSTTADLARAAAILQNGGLVGMPTETVYGLAADARSATAVEGIFRAKQRPHWDPLIVHVNGDEMLRTVVRSVEPVMQRLMDCFWPGPLTLLLPRREEVPSLVTAGRDLVGVRMPAHPVALALIQAASTPLAAPSANRFGHVSPTTADHVLADLGGRIHAVVDAGPCGIGVESTVVEAAGQHLVVYRAGGVSAEQLEHASGLTVHMHAPVQSGAAEPESLPSPGVGMRHYATRARIRLVHSEGELQKLVRSAGDAGAIGVLLPKDWSLVGHTGPLRQTASFGNADGLASELYDGLRALDVAGVREILVPFPARSDGLFAALRDRLEKAARRD